MPGLEEILKKIDELVEFSIILFVIRGKVEVCKYEKEVLDCVNCVDYVDCKKVKKFKKSEKNYEDALFELKCISKINRREIINREEKEVYPERKWY